MVERGGRGSRTLVLLTYYRNFVTCVGADQMAGRAFHHRILRKRGKREPWPLCSFASHPRGAYAAASMLARGVILTTLAFICFAISKHDCLHDSLPSISNQNQIPPCQRSLLFAHFISLGLLRVAHGFRASFSVAGSRAPGRRFLLLSGSVSYFCYILSLGVSILNRCGFLY